MPHHTTSEKAFAPVFFITGRSRPVNTFSCISRICFVGRYVLHQRHSSAGLTSLSHRARMAHGCHKKRLEEEDVVVTFHVQILHALFHMRHCRRDITA
jgi:hypothetical protein